MGNTQIFLPSVMKTRSYCPGKWRFYSWHSPELKRWSSESIIFIVSAVSRHTQNLSEAKTRIMHLHCHVIGASIIHARPSNYKRDRKWAITPFLKRRLSYWMQHVNRKAELAVFCLFLIALKSKYLLEKHVKLAGTSRGGSWFLLWPVV